MSFTTRRIQIHVYLTFCPNCWSVWWLLLQHYLCTAGLLHTLQSGFRPRHSTETVILRVLSDILSAVEREDFAALVQLDLSAAFDTVDDDILPQRLHADKLRHWRRGAAIKWFQSYLTSRTFVVARLDRLHPCYTRTSCLLEPELWPLKLYSTLRE